MKLLDQVRHVIMKKHYSIRTEQAYADKIKRSIPESCMKIDENLLSYQFSPEGKPEASICCVIKGSQ